MSEATSVQVCGAPVHRTVVAPDVPAVTAGRFTVLNHGRDPVRVVVTGVTVPRAVVSTALESYFVYLLPDYEEVRSEGTEVPPGNEDEFEVSFPAQALPPDLTEEVEVEICVLVDGEAQVARSPWSWTIRSPRR